MDRFALLPASERIAYFEKAAAVRNILPELIEKDFWVCWTLQQLFSLDDVKKHITFKGGTSLSKCFNVIHRFSEDIDIAIERKYLGHDKNIEPSLDVGTNENKRRLDGLLTAARKAIHEKIIPPLREKMGAVLGNNIKWSIELDPSDSLKQTHLFVFPALIMKGRPSVKIELGARADNWPSQSAHVLPYVAEVFSGDMSIQPITVKALSVERTFWEKALILHRIYHSPEDKDIGNRMSRHYYDIYEMGRAGIIEKALVAEDLMRDVVNFDRLFFKRSWLNYDEIGPGFFRLVPKNSDKLKSLRADYGQMQPMFFKSPPTFDQIISGLQDMEDQINKI